jgi:hypothetical protein
MNSIRRTVPVLVGILLPVWVGAAVPTHPVQAPELDRAGPEAKALGIAEYQVTHAHEGDQRTVAVDLIASTGGVLGSVQVDWGLRGENLIELRTDTASVFILWDPAGGRFELTDRISGEAASLRLEDREWVGTDESRALMDAHFGEVKMAAIVLTDYLVNSRQLVPPSSLKKASPGLCGIELCIPRCSGPIVRGQSVAYTRAWCCDEANQNAQVQCWNEWCIGCCRTLACDAVCSLGDFFCYCAVTGFSCGPPCP